MNSIVYYLISAVLAAAVLIGLSMQSKVKSAVNGNLLAICAMAAAALVTIFGFNDAWTRPGIWIAVAIGAAVGLFWAKKVQMIQMPQMVGALNGIGGLASALVGAIELFRAGSTVFGNVTAALALVVGFVTFSGSMIAAMKLARIIDGRPRKIPGHSVISALLLILMLASCITAGFGLSLPAFLLSLSAVVFGILFAIRVGGADMPVAISLLNSFSGVAGAIAGMAVYNILLVSVGGIVGSSGLLLTNIMCRAMNRSLADVLLGAKKKPVKTPSAAAAPAAAAVPGTTDTAAPETAQPSGSDMPEKAAAAPAEEECREAPFSLRDAKNVIIVPGYGMALSQAQHKVRELTNRLEANGTQVRFAIHPVAGRMPGHMNVLLAEADIDYDYLFELDAINDDFASADATIVVGASDVMNPAAREAEGTPIYGMPILNVDQCPQVIVCNYDLKPGYAGVENPIYSRGHGVRLLLGDAKDSLDTLIRELSEPQAEESAEAAAAPEAPAEEAAGDGFSLRDAKNVIIVPGYGMALSQAQHKVRELADKLEANGAQVRFAIHPVAGRMPGHMNVLLAEAEIDYDYLYEMSAINDDFATADATIVVGASDVMNPAAREAEGTPIYGMPILNVDQCPQVIVCNYDLKPGYAGVENPIYSRDHGVRLLLGDAKDSLDILLRELSAPQNKAGADAETAAFAAAAQEAEPAEAEKRFSLRDAKNVIIVPGYGMALSQAQHKVRELADKLEANGAQVRFAIHPVAGRMPGHMNVLLAEANIDYDYLYEMSAINDDFATADAAIVVGASDVMNPAAREAEGTPIYGMPILNVDQCPQVIVCNYDLKPGYAGVENPIYSRDHGVRLLLGDAKDSLDILLRELD